MRKVIFWDKSYVLIEDHQEAKIVSAMEGKIGFWLNHKAGRDYIQPGTISRITSAGMEGQTIAHDHQLPEGKREPFDPKNPGPGYKKFQSMRDKLARKKSV